MNKRVLLARLSHETHTFLKERTTLSNFAVLRGAEMLASEGDASSLAGSLRVARERRWDVVPAIAMDAMPGGIVKDEVIETFWEAVQEVAKREAEKGLDGICLNMHGAMVSESVPDVEGELLRRIREIPALADLPICGSLDLHGNNTRAMSEFGTGLVTYRENPHTDIHETAMRAARLLDRLIETGERPVTVHYQPAIVWPPSGTGTANEPMRQLEAEAQRIEAEYPEILAVNVFAGFSFADIRETGVGFSAITLGDPVFASGLLADLSGLAVKSRECGRTIGIALSEALNRIAKLSDGPALLVEPADNIGGGAPGDLTVVLNALLEHRVGNSAVCLNDPEAVDALWDCAPGARTLIAVGGKSGEIGAHPLRLELEVLTRSDGRYTLEDPHSHAAGNGLNQDMGRCVVARCEGVRILLTSRRTPPWDLGQWNSQGINPRSLSAIGVKAAVAHRQAYDPIASASFTLDTPGPCAENLTHLPYNDIRRPIWPLDA